MQTLIGGEGEAKANLQPIDDRVHEHLSQPEQRNAGDQGHCEAVSGGMGTEPPAPVQSVIQAGRLLPCHAIALQHEIAHEMGQHQKNQEIEQRDHGDRHQIVTLRQLARTISTRVASMESVVRSGAMEGDDLQLRHVRERLRLLFDTHLRELQYDTLKPEVGEVVIHEGAEAERVLLVVSGELTVEMQDGSGRPRVLATVGSNELLGEMALIGDYRHSASVRVSHGPAELLSVRADDLLQASLYDSELVMQLLALSSARCRRANGQLSLMLEALDALAQRDRPTLSRCCKTLSSEADRALNRAADLLEGLVQDPWAS
jgi:CRP/FNR family cyclic AMP-dependent transcriptional regulator